jgi:hypothetical protein
MRAVRSLLGVTALFFTVSVATADDVGTFGTLVGLQINTAVGDTFLQYHGRMFVSGESGLQEYRWGGTSCGSRILTEAQVAALQRALDNKLMRIRPVTQTGQAQALCVVGFTLVPKKNLKLQIP